MFLKLKTPSITDEPVFDPYRISTAEFENLIEQPESSILDFKKAMYDFSNDQDHRETAEFVKDIIAFANSIRTESAFIIMVLKSCRTNQKSFIA